MSPLRNLYVRLFLWFVVANVATLAISIVVTERLARMAYDTEPDWLVLAQSANEAWQRGGADALHEWNEHRHREGIDATLFEGERNLMQRPPPPPLMRWLPQLLAEDSVVLRPRPGMILAGEKVVGADGVERRFVGFRSPHPPPPRLGLLLLIQLVLSILVIGVLGSWVARSIARPVAALQGATQRMARGELATRVGAPWAAREDEIGRLAADFDHMAARIEALVAHERSVLQDVSHELRSPLARLHLLLDAARRAPAGDTTAFERAEREIARLDRIIGEALALSRMESQLPGQGTAPVPLVPLLRMRCSEHLIEADARGLRFVERYEAGLQTQGDEALLERAIDNLLSNAIKFSGEGGEIEVSVARDHDAALIAVRDHGPGVPEAELASLFRPFFRGSNAALAEGHGLGLAIVDRIARAHGGAVVARNADGGGLRVELRLPIGA